MAQLLKSDGEVIDNVDISSLEKMQELVGGYIEIIYLNDDKVLIVNEEGLILQLPFNQRASGIFKSKLVGDIILCKINEIE